MWSLFGFIWLAIRGAVPNTGCAWACSLVFVVLHKLIFWLYCSLCIVKYCYISYALLYELLYRRIEPKRALGEWYSMNVLSIISSFSFSSYSLAVSHGLLEQSWCWDDWNRAFFLRSLRRVHTRAWLAH